MATIFQLQLLQLLSFGILAAGGNLFGGWLIMRAEDNERPRLNFLLAFGAGFMLAAVLLEVVPESINRAGGGRAMIWVLAGYLIIQLVEHTIAPHFHFGREQHEREIKEHGAAGTAIAALAIHALFDGITIGSSLMVETRLGILLFIAVLLHKIPEGFTVASIALSAGHSTSSALRATLLIGGATFVGIFFAAAARDFIAIALPLSAGATLYISASDLIPEVNRDGSWKTSLFVFLGVATYFLTHRLLEALI